MKASCMLVALLLGCVSGSGTTHAQAVAACRILAGVHTTTFDSSTFDVLKAGTFNWIDSDALSVQAVTAPLNNKEVAPTKVAVRFGQTVYLFDSNGLQSGSAQSTGVTATQSGTSGNGSLVARLTSNDGTAVEIAQAVKIGTTWASNIKVSLPAGARGKTRGLCGNFDGDPSNDNLTPGGQPVAFTAPQIWYPDGTNLATAWVPQGNQDLFGGSQTANAGAATAPTEPATFGAVKVFKATSPAAGHPSAQMCVPSGYRLLGGGASISTTGVGNYMTASYPDGQCWKADAKDHLVQSIATMDVYAIGIYDPNGLIPLVTLSSTSQVAAHPAVISPTLPPPFVMTGGGAKVTYSGAGNILIASYPNDGNPPNTWVAASKDHDVSDPATVTAYVVGMLTALPTGQKFDIVKVVATQANPASAAEATVALPPGYSVIGGGGLAISTTQAGSLLTDSYPTGNGWTVRSHDRNTPDPAKIAVWAFGIRLVQ
ncbi:VWD domain-containing protein [Dongia sp. agr-C8]